MLIPRVSLIAFKTYCIYCCHYIITSNSILISPSLVVTCAEPASVPDSSRSQEPPYYYHDDLTYTCDLGYELSSGDAIRNCTAGGTWSGTAPTCSRRLRDHGGSDFSYYYNL